MRPVGQELNQSRLANDIGVDHKTISSWLSVLQASYIILLLPPHFKNFRKRVTKSPKLYFYDVGLASFLLGVKNEEQLQHHAMLGNLFENMVVCELLKNRFNRVEENNLFFYRDNKGHDVDVIIDRVDQCDVVEIKSSRTFTNDFLRGIDDYGKINPSIRNRFLIYSGDEEQKIGFVQLRSYNHLGDI